MRIRAFMVCLLIAAASQSFAADLVWESDWDKAFADAEESGKLVLVDYFATWCRPCRKMESGTLRDADVQKRLDSFVLLRINIDRSKKDEEKRVRGVPTYAVYDATGREWFQVFGFWEARDFSRQLDAVIQSEEAIRESASLMDRGRIKEGWLHIASAYNKVRSEDYARIAFVNARAAATKEGDMAAAEFAEIQFAFTWALSGDPRRALRALESIKTASAMSENEALRMLLIGRCCELKKDTARARQSYERAMSMVSKEHVVYAEANTALTRVK